MKKTAYLLVAMALLCAAPVFAQGPFTDVPTDHWAYDAANALQKDGILIGYPDGTFGGKRTITRYEFAVALARLLPMLNPVSTPDKPTGFVTQQQLQDAIKAIPKPDLSSYATKADLDAIRKLVDEFRDEIAALGVDVDALKRDVAALGARVDAIEAEMKRVRFTGNATVFAISETASGKGVTVDQDERTASGTAKNDTLLRDISLVKDFDLKIVGRVSDKTTANATINYGNYLNYLGFVDDYVGGNRPTSTTPSLGTPRVDPATGLLATSSLADTFFPMYAAIETSLGKGSVSVGRFPLQFTPYTLKKIDVDTYTNILKTDDGNYPVDGAKIGYNWGIVDLSLFAVKNDTNLFLINGLTGQPNAGIFDAAHSTTGVLHQLATGHAVGGLNKVTQTAGARANVNIPCNGTLGLTFYQAWDQGNFQNGAVGFDQARVYGADLTFGTLPYVPVPIGFVGSWTECQTLAKRGSGAADVDYQNAAWDGKLTGSFAGVAIGLGYKSIGRNFAAAGSWDKIGRWTNPTNVKGEYADVSYSIMSNLKLALDGEYLSIIDDAFPTSGRFFGNKGDHVAKAEGAVKWGISKNDSLDVSYQWIKFNPNTNGITEATETYGTIALAHQMNPNAGVKVGYQMINYNNGDTGSGPYLNDYKGGLGVVQFGVSF